MIRRITTTLLNLIATDEKRERRRFDSNLSLRSHIGVTPHRCFYRQPEFLRLLYVERRRSERSNRPLCLILLEGTYIGDEVVRERSFRELSERLWSSVRETDIIGWFQQNSILGVVFPDLNTVTKPVVEGLRSKVSKAITTVLTPERSERIDVSVHIFPRHGDVADGAGDLSSYPELPFQHQVRTVSHLVKRLIDVVGSVVLLFLLSPFLLLIALIIKLTSKGPVIFKQVRVGQHGKLFKFWKFRSMNSGNDATIHKEYVTHFISNGQPANHGQAEVYKITNDPRVTAVGRFLRKTSLDELPQLWNVLCGNMSLVGPRPPVPYEFECYALWHRRRTLEVKPGITGLWQVMGRSRTTFNEMVRLDVRYAQQWSIWLDFKILLQTPKAVLMGEGAY